MTCDRALAERLIEITSKPLQKYSTHHHSSYDPYYGLPYYSYRTYKYVWDISSRKRLVVMSSEDALSSNRVQRITGMRVMHHFFGFPFWTYSLDFRTFPESVVETIRQFALDGVESFNAGVAEHSADQACQTALQKLS